ncbi:hypothetical protein J2X69_003044 [Algoriphagus sp. 4150]|uniref:hypothetical protein n=1 Tax=Algoriphagus sp. 4150 TaxID=2817756 RepID=UPI002855BF88|nr:hypothetical protein [Algoriphagus sp. 4150]MDR7130687.1 hypothetical protein [Algoriphagus sp. 4150]
MIEYLEINEKKIPVRINRRVIIKFEKMFKTGLQDLAKIDTDGLSHLLYFGVCEGYSFLNEKNQYVKYEDFEKELDELSINEFFKIATDTIGSFFSDGKK